MSAFKKFMKTGVAEAGLPPLDPLVLDSVDFSLAGAKLTFSNLTAVGLSQHTAEQVCSLRIFTSLFHRFHCLQPKVKVQSFTV